MSQASQESSPTSSQGNEENTPIKYNDKQRSAFRLSSIQFEKLRSVSIRMLDYTTPLLTLSGEMADSLIKGIGAEKMVHIDQIHFHYLDDEGIENAVGVPVLLPGEYLGGEMMRVRRWLENNKDALLELVDAKVKIRNENGELRMPIKMIQMKESCRSSFELANNIVDERLKEAKAVYSLGCDKINHRKEDINSYINNKREAITYTLEHQYENWSLYVGEMIPSSIKENLSPKNTVSLPARMYLSIRERFGFSNVVEEWTTATTNKVNSSKNLIFDLRDKIIDATLSVVKTYGGSLMHMDDESRSTFLKTTIDSATKLYEDTISRGNEIKEHAKSVDLDYIRSKIWAFTAEMQDKFGLTVVKFDEVQNTK